MTEQQAAIGTRVRTLRHFYGIPTGTEGVIVKDYGSGVDVAWDLPDRAYPDGLTPQQVGAMQRSHPQCPLIDGFDKARELHFLEVVP